MNNPNSPKPKAIDAAKCCENATNSKPVCDKCIEESEGYMSQYDDFPCRNNNPQDNVPVKSVEEQEENAFWKKQTSILEYQSRIAELEALNKELINAGQKLLGFAAHLRHEVDYLPDTYYEWMNKVIHETEELLSDDEPDTEQALKPKPLTDENDKDR